MPPRSRLSLWCALISLLLLLPHAPQAQDTRLHELRHYDPARVTIGKGADGLRIALADLESLQEPGKPALPVDRITVEAPAGMRLAEVRTAASGWERLSLDGEPAPFQGSLAAMGHPVPRDPEGYRGVFPANESEILYGGYLRGRRLETVELHPVRYRHRSGELEVAREMQVDLVFEPDPATPVVSRRGPWEPVDRFDRAADRLVTVAAPDAAPSKDRFVPLVNGQEPFSPRFVPSEDGSPVRYLIISPDGLETEFQRLADWKTALGMPAVVRTMSWIRANYPHGLDLAEEVRSFIRASVTDWGVEYVLLGGDVDLIPIRLGKSYFFGGEDIPTDLYMACLDGNWDANGDALFGEPYFNATYSGDSADLYPEVWVGRASVRTAPEAGDFVNKVIAYEGAAPVGSGFGDQMLVLGEMLFPQNWAQGDTILFDGAQVAEDAVGLASAKASPYRMYENYTAYPGSIEEIKANVISEIDVGYNVVLHVGHGFRNTMAVGKDGLTLNNGDADGFVNGVRQGLIYAINCTSSALDFDCIAEHLVRNPQGGAVASIGSTRLDFPSTGWNYQNEFFDLVFNRGVTKLGEAAAQQKFPFIALSNRDGEHRWTQFNLMFLGDPDMDLYTGAVGTLSASVAESLVLGQANYTVTVTDGSGPVAGATVCLNKVADAYGYAITDSAGIAVVAFDPDTPGMASLGLRAHNHVSVVDSVMVSAPAAAHLFVGGLTVDDSVGGDGDGTLEAGESALLFPAVVNRGSSQATAVALRVLVAPVGLSFADSVSTVGTVDPDSTATGIDPIAVTVASTVSDLSTLLATVEISATGYTRQEPLVLYVGSPSIDAYSTVFSDTVGNGNGDGVLQAGEDQKLSLFVKNVGVGTSTGLTAVLTSADPAVTILDGNASYGAVQPGQQLAGDGFSFRLADTSLGHSFDVTFSDQRGPFLTRSFTLAPPSAVTGLAAGGGATWITLTWTPNPEADLRGYNIYRSSSPGGPFLRANDLVTDKISYFEDENLPPLTRFYYQVTAVDIDGNEGGASLVAQATTSLPAHGGFPLIIGATASSSPCIGYFNGDTKAEVIAGGSEVYVTTDAGIEYLDGDQDAQTYGVFDGTGFGPFWTPPAVGDLDGDGIPELAACGWSSGMLHVWDSKGNIRPGWPKNVNIDGVGTPNIWSAPVFADVDSDGRMEVFINAGKYTFAFHDDGTELVDGDANPATDGVLLVMGTTANYGTPAVADLNNDGVMEIIVGSRDGNLYVLEPDGTSLPGFPFASGGDITGSPAIGDLNNDGLKEVVFGTGNLQVQAVDVNLNSPPNWPAAANMNQDFDASPALADLDGDGFLDVVVCAGNGTVYVFRGQNGLLFPGWGLVLYDSNGAKVGLSSSPAIGNIDADPDLEICFGGNDGNLYAYNLDATPVDGFPIGTNNRIEGGPLIWDIDDDGLTEVVAQSLDEQVYVWDSPGVFDPANQPWPMFHQNSRRTGEVGAAPYIKLGTPGGEGAGPAPILGANAPNPFSSATAFTFRVPEGAGRETPVRLRVFDINGRLVRTLVDGPLAAGSHRAQFDGRREDGTRLGAGIYFYRLDLGGLTRSRKMVLVR